MLEILWWLCKLGLLVTFGLPFIILGGYLLLIFIVASIQSILIILEDLNEKIF